MRAWQLAAIAAATMTTHGTPAAAEALAPAGLSGGWSAGGVLGVTTQPGKRLSDDVRLRVDYDLPSLSEGIRPPRGGPRPKRIAAMLDYYPQAESGLRVSAGMRFLARRGRSGWSPSKVSQPGALIYSPPLIGTMPLRTNIARTAPAMTMGWTQTVSRMAAFGIEAGTLMAHGGAARSAASLANPELRAPAWSRVDPVAQVAFALRF